MSRLLDFVFGRVVLSGNLTVIDPDGQACRFGDGTGPAITMRVKDRSLGWKLVIDPSLYLGESYMNRGFEIEEGTVYDLVALLMRNVEALPAPPRWTNLFTGLRTLTRRLQQRNPLGRAKDNVAHHYDLDARLYELFLDRDLQYSCAYFEHDDDTLEQAQLAKKRHIAAKLDIRDGQRILDIGSGWGGLSLYLAQCADVEVVGITLSEEQLARSRARASEAGLASRVDFQLQDYRTLDDRFDRIVSVGMFEHVGVGYYPQFFRRVRALLDEDGVALLHSLGRFDGPGHTNPWIKKYIFPGGYIPAMSEVLSVIEKARLYTNDIEILRLHYAKTIAHWRKRFAARRDEALTIYDDRFCRMWEFYLAASEGAIRYQNMMVFQMQLTRKLATLPLTRNYMREREDELRRARAPRVVSRRAGE